MASVHCWVHSSMLVVVERARIKPCWLQSIRLWYCGNKYCIRIIDCSFISSAARWCNWYWSVVFRRCGGTFLWMGVTRTIFHSWGNFWSLKDASNKWDNGVASNEADFFRNKFGIPLGSADSEDLRPSRQYVVWTVKNSKKKSRDAVVWCCVQLKAERLKSPSRQMVRLIEQKWCKHLIISVA